MNEGNMHWGSTLNDFLHEEGIYEEAKAQAATRVISWQLAQEMKKKASRKPRWPSMSTSVLQERRARIFLSQTQSLPAASRCQEFGDFFL